MATNNTKEQILNAACILFSENGYKQTSVEKIAFSLNMGKSSLYYYFKDKDEIYASAWIKELDHFNLRIKKEVESQKKGKRQVKRFLFLRINEIGNYPLLFETLYNQEIKELEVFKKHKQEFERNEYELLSKIMYDASEKGKFRSTEPMLIELLLTLCKGLEYEKQFLCKTVDERRINDFVNELVDGLK